MTKNEEMFVTGLTTDQDSIEEIVEETTSAIEKKSQQLQYHNRVERRAFVKKLGKKGREQFGTISETAKKLNYINLIQKIKELKEKNENEVSNENN